VWNTGFGILKKNSGIDLLPSMTDERCFTGPVTAVMKFMKRRGGYRVGQPQTSILDSFPIGHQPMHFAPS